MASHNLPGTVILWILKQRRQDGQEQTEKVRRMRYAQLDPILIELSGERKIMITGEVILLIILLI